MSNVYQLKTGEIGAGRRVAPARVLAGARLAKLTEIVVIGMQPDGDLYIAGSEGPGDTVWLMEAAKLKLLRSGEDY